nr:hypothetical protein [uncultured Cohaesibacter sp.]
MSFILSLFKNWRVALGLACILALIGSHVVAYWKGYSSASEACQTAALEAEIGNLKRTIQISETALDASVQRAQAREADATSLEQKVEAYEAQLENAGSCILSASDARRLSEIR